MSDYSRRTTPFPPETINEPKLPGDAFEAHWAFAIARDNWRWLLKVTFAGLVFFAVVSLLIPTRYEAVARLMPPDQSASGTGGALLGALMSGGSDLLASLGSGSLGLHNPGATMVGVLTSRTVEDDIINKFDLRAVYYRKRYVDTRKILERRSSIGEDRRSGIITIAVQDTDRQRAANIAQAYVDDLNARVANLTTSSAHRERVFLEGRIQKVKQQLDDATLRLSQFSSKNRTLDPLIQGKAELDAASALQGQLIAAETELSGLQQIYGSGNYRVKAVGAKVGELRAKLRSLSGSHGAEDDLENQLYPSLEQLPLLGNTYFDLARQAKIEETLYEILTKQYELAKVEEAKELPSIKVLDEPVVPERKAFPPRLLITCVGAFLVLLSAIGWLAARKVWLRLPDTDPIKIGTRELMASISNGRHKSVPMAPE
ncbi:MAG: lipopolysaccharide biosynthesis protein [Candidatus Korobacteraceae bacterium]